MKHRRIQIVGRIPSDLHRRVRAVAKRRKVTLNAFVIEALTAAVGGTRSEAPSAPPR